MLLTAVLLAQAIMAIFISGILYSFSDFIMRALDDLPPKNAVAAMQNINVSVYRSIFMVVFISLVPLSIAVSIWSIITTGWSGSLFVLVGTLLYVFGMFILTGTGNVPLNESLKQIDASHQEAVGAWKSYYKRWTRLNTLRCIFGVAAGVCWTFAACFVL